MDLCDIIRNYSDLRKLSLLPITSVVTQTPKPLPPLQVVFSGSVNAGKSTLINSIIGTEVLPTSSVVCTSRITVIRNSRDSKFRVMVKDSTPEEFENIESLQVRLPLIVGGEAKTSIVEVIIEWVGSDFLNLGLEIVDTPGFNENKDVREASLEYMKKSAVVLFVINREDGCLVTENIAALHLLRTAGVLPLFLVNKVDEIPDPRLYRTPAQRQKFKEENEIAIKKIKESLKDMFPELESSELGFFTLSALDACLAKENKKPVPEPFQRFLNGLGTSLHLSLCSLVDNHLKHFINQVTIMMKEVKTADNVKRGLDAVYNMITKVKNEKDEMKRKLLKTLSEEFDVWIEANKTKLMEELISCQTPAIIKDTEFTTNQQTVQFLITSLQNKILAHLQAHATEHYKTWDAQFLHTVTEFAQEGQCYWDPNSVLVSLSIPCALSPERYVISLILKRYSYLLRSCFRDTLALEAVVLGYHKGETLKWRTKIVDEILNSTNLELLKKGMLFSFLKTCNIESNKIIKALTTIGKTLKEKLDPKKQQEIKENLYLISNVYLEFISSKTTFQVGEPIIHWDKIVSPGNSWGLIYKATLCNKDYFAQVIAAGVPLSYNYLGALGDHYLVNLKEGKRAILRESLWGHNELSISTEGNQPALNNFLVNSKVDENTLRESLVMCFIEHGILPTNAEKEVRNILTVANDFVRFQIDVNNKAATYCINGKPPDLLECVAVTAYTMESNLYKFLNEDLRSTSRTDKSIEKWRPFLFLFLSAMKKMKPVTPGSLVYRGVNCQIPDYMMKFSPEREGIYWYTITSTSNDKQKALEFATQDSQHGMLFEISLSLAYSIDWLSLISQEGECIFVPGSSFKVTKITEEANCVFIQMQQIPIASYFM